MSDKPTPLEDFHNCILAATDGRSPEAVFNECCPDTMIYERLVAFLRSPAVQALFDPATAAAAAVVIAKLPELLEMEKQTGDGLTFLAKNLKFGRACAQMVVDANHEAAQAAKAQEEKP